MKKQFLEIGRIVNTHGIGGEIKVDMAISIATVGE